ncbi:hypothetical protein [Pedobacter montanisoli]|uniref:DUF4136 domain-containing protein n=1 Tax=Pedobacter montanisoli TaxID=2923277 RepID=A0ABS9ZV03_9SPHI|nr:hypothetical protein [Pedobacter montanisoli]MCJ0741879.1 hypothetical protein [Pedobacter montanisoli]
MKFFFSALFFLFIGISVNAQKFKSTEPSSAISDIHVISAVSNIFLISEGNKPVFNDSLSVVANGLLNKAIKDNLVSFKEIKEIDEKGVDSLIKNKAIIALFNEIFRNKKLDSVKIPQAFNTLFGDKAKYTLVTLQRGFTRNKGNFGKQVGKSLATGLLTLGMVNSTPIKYNSSIYVCIINNELKKISFFNYSVQQIDPLDSAAIQKQYLKLFQKYFN